jgi:hypothetical protein
MCSAWKIWTSLDILPRGYVAASRLFPVNFLGNHLPGNRPLGCNYNCNLNKKLRRKWQFLDLLLNFSHLIRKACYWLGVRSYALRPKAKVSAETIASARALILALSDQ